MFARSSSPRTRTRDDAPTGRGLAFLGGIGLGAALMYFFDPQAGRRRRARLHDRYAHTTRKLQDAHRIVVRDASHRVRGLIAQANRFVKREGRTADDVVVVERVRSAIGRVVSHPHAIEVHSSDGRVLLEGAVLAGELDSLIACVEDVRGVSSVDNQLDVHADSSGIARAGARSAWMQDNWSPSARTVGGGVGAGLALFGFLRGGLGGLVVGAIGTALFARAASNRDVRSLIAVGEKALIETGNEPHDAGGHRGGEARSLH
ncbi:MAG: BON domain-containing protein [Bacillota bacterium]